MDPTKGRPVLEGLLLVDKPEGPTSHDQVRDARRALGVRRIGHTGTLDPFASGLLLLCVGRTTRLAEYFHLLTKSYEAVAVLGERTDTDDRTGTAIETSERWRDLTPEDVRLAASRLVGRMDQIPPAFSAKKVGGRRAYAAARAGEHLELDAVSVLTHRISVTRVEGREVSFETDVSTGTYVRSLARDLGEDLGCHAYLSALRRTSIGPFHVRDATTVDKLDGTSVPDTGWMSPAEALAWLPGHQLSAPQLERVQLGLPIPDPFEAGGERLPVTLLEGDRLVAVARSEAGELRPEKVFPVQ